MQREDEIRNSRQAQRSQKGQRFEDPATLGLLFVNRIAQGRKISAPGWMSNHVCLERGARFVSIGEASKEASRTQTGGEPHFACFGLDPGDGLLRIEPTDVYARGSR
jgi:hypothetical protein